MSDLQPLPQRETVGAEYGGRWIAWNESGLKIIASGKTYQEACQASEAQGVNQPILEYIPESDAGFVGGL